MDMLQEYVGEYEKLLNIQYYFIVGKKGKIYEYTVDFRKEDFHHVVGLKKLNDLACLNGDRAAVFDAIKSGDITYETISGSVHFTEIKDRFDAFSHFCEIFTNENTVFKYMQKTEYSKIPADFLIMNEAFEKPIYLFIGKRTHQNFYCCVSFFPQREFIYEKGQSKLTVLKVEEINSDTQVAHTVYLNSHYKP